MDEYPELRDFFEYQTNRLNKRRKKRMIIAAIFILFIHALFFLINWG